MRGGVEEAPGRAENRRSASPKWPMRLGYTAHEFVERQLERRRQTVQAETAQDAFHARTTQRIGEVLLKNTLPGHFYARRDRHANRPHGIQSTSK